MADDDERNVDSNTNRNTETNSNINPLSELPGRPYTITMEVPLFCSMLALSLSGAIVSNIIYYRTCVHSLHHSPEECQVFLSPGTNNVSKSLEEEVQKYATFVSTVKIVLESLAPSLLSLFLGVWSDTHGRKPLVVWPLLGLTISSMMIVVYSMMENLGPWFFVLTSVPASLTGGVTVLFTGAFCYVSDISSTENRSLRMTIVEAAFSAGSIVGGILSSYLLKSIGHVNLLLLVSALYTIAYAFTNLHVRESLTGAVQGGICSVIDFLLVKEMVRECFKRRPNYGRAQILLLTIANCTSIFILYGILGLEYGYTREKLDWSMKDYTVYSSVHTTITLFGSFLGVGLVQKVFGVSDLALTMIAFISTTIEFVAKGLAITTWHMYLGAGITLFRGLSSPLIRSFLTKALPVKDIAKVFALMCAIEGICPLISPIMYSALYTYTITSFPSAIYVLSSCLTGACIVMVGIVQYLRRNVTTPYEPLNTDVST